MYSLGMSYYLILLHCSALGFNSFNKLFLAHIFRDIFTDWLGDNPTLLLVDHSALVISQGIVSGMRNYKQ